MRVGIGGVSNGFIASDVWRVHCAASIRNPDPPEADYGSWRRSVSGTTSKTPLRTTFFLSDQAMCLKWFEKHAISSRFSVLNRSFRGQKHGCKDFRLRFQLRPNTLGFFTLISLIIFQLSLRPIVFAPSLAFVSITNSLSPTAMLSRLNSGCMISIFPEGSLSTFSLIIFSSGSLGYELDRFWNDIHFTVID